jgi:uncharacterized phiE125 gp8 family phage protein
MALLTLKAPAYEPVTVAQLISYGHIDSNEDQAFLGMLISAAREWCEVFCARAFVFQTKRLLLDYFPLAGIGYAIVLPWPMVREVLVLQYQNANDGAMIPLEPGTDFILDIDSQPARLMPLFGHIWPVARVVANAVQVDYMTGFSGPIIVGMTAGSPLLDSPFNFLPRDVGQPISIPNAAAGGKTPLAALIAAVDIDGRATLDQAAGATVAGQTTTFGAVPISIQLAILALASQWYEKRLPDDADIPFGVKALLYPYRDLRL